MSNLSQSNPSHHHKAQDDKKLTSYSSILEHYRQNNVLEPNKVKEASNQSSSQQTSHRVSSEHASSEQAFDQSSSETIFSQSSSAASCAQDSPHGISKYQGAITHLRPESTPPKRKKSQLNTENTSKLESLEIMPREKLVTYGSTALSNVELVAILLRTGTKGMDVMTVSESLVDETSNSLDHLARMTVEEISSYKGIGKVKAITLKTALELGYRRLSLKYREDRPKVLNLGDITLLMTPLIGDLPYEEVWVLGVNAKLEVVNKQLVGSGGVSSSIADIRRIMYFAVTNAVVGIILVHNHPSGDPTPSPQDITLFKNLRSACKVMHVDYVDNVVIGLGHESYSFRKEGYY